MINWQLLDLKAIFTLLRADPASIPAEALEAIAHLCDPASGGWENEFRWVLRAWPVQSTRLPYIPRWIQVDNDYPAGSAVCGTAEECALLRAILHTAAQLRQAERFTELSALADAVHNYPEMMAQKNRRTLRYVRSELRRVRRDFGVTLLTPPPPDRQSTLEKIMPYARIRCTSGGTES